MYHLITIGDAVIDTHVNIDNASVECDLNKDNCHLCLDYGRKIPITDSFQALGGNAANVAVGAARLGLKTAILTSLGEDTNGHMAFEELRKQGVATELIHTDKKNRTRYSVVLNFQGERTILSYHQPTEYAWPKKLPETAWIYFTSLSKGYKPLQESLVAFLRAHKSVRLAFNPGSFQIKNSLGDVRELVSLTDLLILNIEEAEAILQTTLESEKGVEVLIHRLVIRGANEVVITDGARGAWAGTANELWHMPSFPVTVISKTGAGDAFSAAYLTARFSTHGIPTALQWGIANSCSTITAHGPQKNLLDQRGIAALIKRFSAIRPKELV